MEVSYYIIENLHFHDVDHYDVEHDQQDQGEVIDEEEEGQGVDFV